MAGTGECPRAEKGEEGHLRRWRWRWGFFALAAPLVPSQDRTSLVFPPIHRPFLPALPPPPPRVSPRAGALPPTINEATPPRPPNNTSSFLHIAHPPGAFPPQLRSLPRPGRRVRYKGCSEHLSTTKQREECGYADGGELPPAYSTARVWACSLHPPGWRP